MFTYTIALTHSTLVLQCGYSACTIVWTTATLCCWCYRRYVTMAFPLGNFAALRTMRVLRALKTVAVVPGASTPALCILAAKHYNIRWLGSTRAGKNLKKT